MYISKIKLENVRCLQKAELTFDENNRSAIIAGNNGSGKSAILRATAMGLCDRDSSAALLREFYGDFIYKEEDAATIEIELYSVSPKKRWKIQTEVVSKKYFDKVKQSLFRWQKNRWVYLKSDKEEDSFPWDQIFATGYGSGLRAVATEEFREYFTPDAVYSLFQPKQALQNPELAWRRIEQARQSNQKPNKNLVIIEEILAEILQLKKEEKVFLGRDNIFVKKGRLEVPLRAMADGFQSTIALTLDFLFWVLLKANAANKNLSRYIPLNKQDLKGIFIIDEIETHLHPAWQKEIFLRLQQQFPEVQFITSTHSPLVISGSGKAPTWFIDEEHNVSQQAIDGWLAENVYLEMGLDSSRPNYKLELVSKYKKLHRKYLVKDLNETEKKDFAKITRELKNSLPSSDIALLEARMSNFKKE